MAEKRSDEQNQRSKGTTPDMGMGVTTTSKKDDATDTAESKKKISRDRGTEQLEAMRNRLYSRTHAPGLEERHVLSGVRATAGDVHARNTKEVHRIDEELERPQEVPRSVRPSPPPVPATIRTDTPVATIIEEMPQTKKITLKGYRTKIIAVAVIFFVIALVLSSSFLFFGQNTISGNNIAIDVEAPFAIGGGEELALKVAVTNRNAVTVESATLIVEYPTGTQEVGTSGKELFRQRVSMGSIKPGEVLSIPVNAKIFGEENEEKTINISVEYRVQGSNATFFKEADPLKLKISSSPVILSIEGVKEISSGQELALTLSLASNSSVPLSDLLVQAEYPQGFDFSESNPKAAKGQSLWSISELAPGAKEQITIKGVMTGGSTEARTFAFSVGVPSERDRFTLASVLTKASTEVTLTDPFVGLKVTTNGKEDRSISVGQNDSVNVSITFENTLKDTIYDGTITATLSGNGLNASNVSAAQGFFDSSSKTVVWDKSQVSGLSVLAPGDNETVNFTIRGANLDAARTPQVSYDVSVTGRRVSETRVPQELTNIESRTIRFESVASIASHGLYSTGPFQNSGPMPPKAEAVTQYTIMLGATNGSNELADATVTMTLPSYITWSDKVSSGDNVAYNPSSREVTWNIGNLDANASVDAAFQVSFLPSISQVGTVPVLAGEQRFRATDRFTGTVIRATAPAITTNLPEDSGANTQGGRVEPK